MALARLLTENMLWTVSATELVPGNDRADELVTAAKKARILLAGKTFEQAVRLDCKLWEKGITFPPEIGAAKPENEEENNLEIVGAFRGFFANDRIAFVQEKNDTKEVVISLSYDEKKFFHLVGRISTKELTFYTIRYSEKTIGSRVDSRTLLEVVGQDDDLTNC